MKTAENFSPEPLSARQHDSFVPAIISFAEDDFSKARQQIDEQAKATAVHNRSVAHMLNGFSIGPSPEAKPISQAVSHSSKPEVKHDNEVCTTGYASYYHPTGNATADGSAYTANNRLKAAAVDNKEPMGQGHVWLGSKLHVKSLDDHSQAIDVTVRDTGGFGKLNTPEPGKARLIDLTDAAFEALHGDKSKGLIPVEVCYQSDEIRHKPRHKSNHKK